MKGMVNDESASLDRKLTSNALHRRMTRAENKYSKVASGEDCKWPHT